ncbi:TasA family protein [Virgibacillus halodenitrificans]|uniref:TasA family protein n=1 Tax=Virgibacillus halodenitrificans TaxID=1482 RepID=UPI002DB59B79|nr:TasA family protein [Virgibacillus halodenitrificans]MEC2160554.1 TasA family protein [Virgibacillus halodenitrificans]
MSIKKKLGMGIATAVLGVGLIGGGTFAYFSDAVTTNNTFAAGTLDLSVDPTAIIEVDNIKPGDTMLRTFELVNNGSLDIASVLLDTSYSVTDAKGDNGNADLGHHIMVNFLENDGHPEHWFDDDSYTVVASKTLAELTAMTPDDLAVELEDYLWWDYEEDGIPVGETDNMRVQFEFVDEGDQNIFQGDSLELEWKFTAKQTDGEER